MRHPKLNLRPPRVFAPLQAMWLLWAVLACTVLSISAWIFATRIHVAPTQRHVGVFESTVEAVPVIVPAGVSLSTLMVTEGSMVAKGQKLAQFNQSALRDLVEKTNAELTRNRLLRACLLNDEDIIISAPTPAITIEDGADLRDASALADCINTHRRNRLARERLQHKRDFLRHESKLAIKELTLRAQGTEEPVHTILTLRAALERINLDATIRDTEFELALLRESQKQALIAQVQTLETTADTLTKDLIRLESLQQTPWLRAPQNGRIERVRDLAGATARDVDLVLAQIHRADDTTYTAYFDLPLAQANLLAIGDDLEVSLAGLPQNHRRLLGFVVSVSPGFAATRGMARVEVQFSEERLADTTAQALTSLPAGTRSTMQVTLPAKPFSDVLRATAQPLAAAF